MSKHWKYEDDLPEDDPARRRRTDIEVAEDDLEVARRAQQDEFIEYGRANPVPHLS
jgi:hypothetical protein